MIRQLNRLYQTVRSPAHRAQAPSEIFQPLMMVAVDIYYCGPADAGNERSILELHLMKARRLAIPGLIVLKCARETIGYVFVQRAPQTHVDQLAAPADTQERFAVANKLSQ